MDDDIAGMSTVLLVFVFAFLAALAANGCAVKTMQIEAVEHGAATWVVQPDGSTVFEWKPPAPAGE